MYRDLQEIYWWNVMKRDIVDFVSQSPNCKQVKGRTSETRSTTQEIDITTWKWEVINMEVITCLTRTRKQNASIWVIVDKVTKVAQFLAIKTTDSAYDYANLCINEIVRFHGVPFSILIYRGPYFTSYFQKYRSWYLGKSQHIFNLQTDGQVEYTIRTLEGILRDCVIDFKYSWDNHLPHIEFSYNNIQHYNIQMPPYKKLYRRICKSLAGWFEVGEATLIRTDLVHDSMEKFCSLKIDLKKCTITRRHMQI